MLKKFDPPHLTKVNSAVAAAVVAVSFMAQ